MSKARYRYNRFVNVAEKEGFISPLVHIGQFQKDCNTVLEKTQVFFRKENSCDTSMLQDQMALNDDLFQGLENDCSPSAFVCPRETEIIDWDDASSIPNDTGLATVDIWKRFHEERVDPITLIRNRLLISKYTEMSCALHAKASETKAKSPEDRVPCPSIIITVSVCFPWEIRSTKATGVDFYVLGSQKLTELRDRIPCALDQQPTGLYSDYSDGSENVKLKDICTSSLFYIENTFYNDLRAPSSVDLSKYITKWCKGTATAIPSKTKCVDMNQVCFNDLKVRLGCPYVFLHQGACEHLVVFKDIRLFSASDCQSRSSYPVTASKPKIVGYPCQICGDYLSTWATRWDEFAEGDPGMFCDCCFRMLHYDKEGNKMCHFVAFRKINVGELVY